MMNFNHTIHKYKRINLSSKKDKKHYVFQCILPNCPHYISAALIAGKMSHCHECDRVFVIEKNKRKPICSECWQGKYGKKEVMDIVDDILGEKIL